MKKAILLTVFVTCFASAAFAANEGSDGGRDPLSDALGAPLRATEGLVASVFDVTTTLVSGKRLPSPVEDFAAESAPSATAVTRDDFRLAGARNVPEAMAEVPGIVLSDIVGNGEEPTLDFRGFNEGQDFVFLLDGVRLNEAKSNNVNYPLVPLVIVDRLEVSRSGASFLYGEGAMGGVANLVTRVPDKPGYHVELESRAGSFGEWGEAFEATAREGSLGALLAGEVYHREGFRQNTSVDKGSFYSKLQWDPTPVARVSASYLYAEADLDRSGSIRESLLRSRGPEATERPRNFAELDSHLAVADVRVAPDDMPAVSANAFVRRTGELSTANFATFVRDDNELDLTVETWGATLQADHAVDLPWGIRGGLLLGADVLENGIDEEDFNRSKATLNRLGTTVDAESDKDSAGVFGKLSASFSERFGAYYGIRYDDIDFQNRDFINLTNNVPGEVSRVSHATGGSWKATPETALSAAYSKSFRAPTLADLYANPLFGGNPNLEEEEASNYEAGAKWERGSHSLSGSFFLTNLKNEIGFDPNLTDAAHPFGQNGNFGKTRRWGVETALETRPISPLRLRASHTYTEAYFLSNDNGGTQKSDDRLPMVPRNRFTASVLWEVLPDLHVRLGLLAVSKQVLVNDLTNDRNGRRLPAYATFDFMTRYRRGDWELSFEVKNLFDEDYELGGSLGVDPAFATNPSDADNFFVPAPERSFHVTVRYRF